MERAKKKSLSWYKKKLWEVFAAWIKKRDRGRCFTCSRTGLEGKNYHAGHFEKASICGLALYFDEDNVHGQCYYCNIYLDGNQYEYGVRLGKKRVGRIRKIRAEKKGERWDREKYEERIEHYKVELSGKSGSLLEN